MGHFQGDPGDLCNCSSSTSWHSSKLNLSSHHSSTCPPVWVHHRKCLSFWPPLFFGSWVELTSLGQVQICHTIHEQTIQVGRSRMPDEDLLVALGWLCIVDTCGAHPGPSDRTWGNWSRGLIIEAPLHTQSGGSRSHVLTYPSTNPSGRLCLSFVEHEILPWWGPYGILSLLHLEFPLLIQYPGKHPWHHCLYLGTIWDFLGLHSGKSCQTSCHQVCWSEQADCLRTPTHLDPDWKSCCCILSGMQGRRGWSDRSPFAENHKLRWGTRYWSSPERGWLHPF